VYLAGINGCSAYYTQQVRGIEIVLADIFPGGIIKYDFESLSPLIVTMDSHGGSLHKQVEAQKRKKLAEMCPPK
jgi:tartrate dehydratase beta subunit/fumarate hydratase class I family protein